MGLKVSINTKQSDYQFREKQNISKYILDYGRVVYLPFYTIIAFRLS